MTADIELSIGAVPREPLENAESDVLALDGSDIHVRIPDLGRLAIRDGRRIVIDPADGVPPTAFQPFLLGSVLGMLLIQRGAFVLHGSVVARDGRAVAFLGRRGAGKSTVAAALVGHRWQLVADDKAVVDLEGSTATVRTGPPLLKLMPAVADRLDVASGRPVETTAAGKRLHRLPAGRGKTHPLARIYLLAETDGTPRLEPLPPGARTGELLANVYRPALVEATGSLPARFGDCVTLARHVPIKRLHVPRRIEALPRVRTLIDRDLEHAA